MQTEAEGKRLHAVSRRPEPPRGGSFHAWYRANRLNRGRNEGEDSSS